MESFIDFYFHFLANFQSKTSPHMFSILTHVMKPVRDTNSEPGLPVFRGHFPCIVASVNVMISCSALSRVLVGCRILKRSDLHIRI